MAILGNLPCPPPVLGEVYRVTDVPYGGSYIYLSDGLHQIPSVELYNALGLNAAQEVAVTTACIQAIGLSSPLPNGYPQAHATILNGMGQQIFNQGLPGNVPPPGSSGTGLAVSVPGAGFHLNASGIMAEVQKHPLIAAGLVGLFLAETGLLRGGGRRRGLL